MTGKELIDKLSLALKSFADLNGVPPKRMTISIDDYNLIFPSLLEADRAKEGRLWQDAFGEIPVIIDVKGVSGEFHVE